MPPPHWAKQCTALSYTHQSVRESPCKPIPSLRCKRGVEVLSPDGQGELGPLANLTRLPLSLEIAAWIHPPPTQDGSGAPPPVSLPSPGRAQPRTLGKRRAPLPRSLQLQPLRPAPASCPAAALPSGEGRPLRSLWRAHAWPQTLTPAGRTGSCRRSAEFARRRRRGSNNPPASQPPAALRGSPLRLRVLRCASGDCGAGHRIYSPGSPAAAL